MWKPTCSSSCAAFPPSWTRHVWARLRPADPDVPRISSCYLSIISNTSRLTWSMIRRNDLAWPGLWQRGASLNCCVNIVLASGETQACCCIQSGGVHCLSSFAIEPEQSSTSLCRLRAVCIARTCNCVHIFGSSWISVESTYLHTPPLLCQIYTGSTPGCGLGVFPKHQLQTMLMHIRWSHSIWKRANSPQLLIYPPMLVTVMIAAQMANLTLQTMRHHEVNPRCPGVTHTSDPAAQNHCKEWYSLQNALPQAGERWALGYELVGY